MLKKLYSPLAFDSLFAALGLTCGAMLVQWSGLEIPPIAPATNALAKGGALVGVAVAGALFALMTTRYDQKLADDYTFQTLCKSALVAMMAFAFAMAFWAMLFADNLGAISSYSTVALLFACWSVSYFIVRLRGTGA